MSPEEHTEAFRESLSACLASVQGRIVAEVAHVAEDLYRALEHELLELIAGRLEDLDSSSGMAATPKPEVSRVLTAEVDTLRRNLMATSDALVLLAQRTTGRPLQMTNQPPPQSNQFMSNPLGVLARHASHGSHSIHHPSFTAEEDALRPSHRTSDEASPKLRPHLGMLVKHSREDPEHHEEEHHEHHHEHLHLHLPHVHSPEDSEATTLRLVAESEETKDRSSGSGHGRSRTSVGPIEKTRLHEFVESSYFDNFFTLVIIANCITMGIEAHYQVVGDDHAGEMLAYGEYFFTLLFSIELLCRYKVFGWRYFTPYDKEGMMNFLDMMLVLVTGILFGVFVPILGFISGTDFSNGYFRYLTMVRVIRLLRLVRVLRKAPLLRDMFLMLRGLTESFGMLFWTIIVIASLTYIFAVFGLVFIGKNLLDQWEDLPHGDAKEEVFELLDMINGIDKMMFTLIQVLTLDSWTGYVRTLIIYVWWAWSYFYIYIAVADFVLMNLVTAIIVDNAVSKSANDQEQRLQELEKARQAELNTLQDIFQLMDEDGDGTLSWDEFTSAFEDEDIRKQWRLLDVGADECKGLFQLLDEGDGKIETHEFFEGMSAMKGSAQAKDIFRVGKMVEKMDHKLSSFITASGRGNGGQSPASEARTKRLETVHQQNQELCARQAALEELVAKSQQSPILETRSPSSVDGENDEVTEGEGTHVQIPNGSNRRGPVAPSFQPRGAQSASRRDARSTAAQSGSRV